jgi:hypothetical protein
MPCDKLHKPATKSKCQSIDSPNPHQGMLVGTNTSLQKRPGLDVVGSGAGERKRTMSSRFWRKTRRAGSSSSSSLGLGPEGDSIIFVELKNSEPISMNTRRKDGRISCNYSPAPCGAEMLDGAKIPCKRWTIEGVGRCNGARRCLRGPPCSSNRRQQAAPVLHLVKSSRCESMRRNTRGAARQGYRRICKA